MRLAWSLGGNLHGASPDLDFAARAMSRIDMVVHLHTTLNSGHAWGRGRETIVLPVQARDEESQRTTQESMFNFVRLSEGGTPRHEGPRSEVDVITAVAEKVLDDDAPLDIESLRRHERIREAIAMTIPGYQLIGDIDETREEFQIEGRTLHAPGFATPSGRAKMHAIDLPEPIGTGDGELRLMTVRSEGQFNTVVYEDHDLYRGQERRDVIMVNEGDLARLGVAVDDRVTVHGPAGEMPGILVRTIDIPPGNAVMYFPEANVLIPKVADERSRTPAYKNVVVRVLGEEGTEGLRE
jgi:anaerobic selenocysteine-containing dehydrogenase